MIKITIEGKQGVGKTEISESIKDTFHGRFQRDNHFPTMVYILEEGEKLRTKKNIKDYDIVITTKQK